MVIVSPHLVNKFLEKYPLLEKAWRLLEEDVEVQQLLRMSNIMAVTRLKYNDHGPVHARIVAGSALEIFDLLVKGGIEPTTIRDNVASSLEESMLVVLLASYLHDIGNSVHRDNHEFHGYILAKDILDRLLPDVVSSKHKVYALRQEILHAIYSTDYDVKCLTVEAGVVKIADGTDMAEGRARVPYRLGKIDMHSVSALSIKRVDIESGVSRPVRINVYMTDKAGLFQVLEVLMPKVNTSGIGRYLEISVYVNGSELVTYIPE